MNHRYFSGQRTDWLLIIALTLVPASSGAVEKQYLAAMGRAMWQFEGAATLCSLRHPIPEFGYAQFSRNDRGRWALGLEATGPTISTHREGSLYLLTPPWRHLDPEPDTITVLLKPGKRPLEFSGTGVTRLLDGLQRGYLVSLEFDSEPGRGRHRVALSPVKFAPAYREWLACIDALPIPQLTAVEAGFQDLLFASNGFVLDSAAAAMLDRLAGYLAEHPEIEQLELSGHADSTGSEKRNQGLSRHRVDAAADYLIERGVSAQRIARRHAGATEPVGDNKTAPGRAANRRVSLVFTYAKAQ